MLLDLVRKQLSLVQCGVNLLEIEALLEIPSTEKDLVRVLVRTHLVLPLPRVSHRLIPSSMHSLFFANISIFRSESEAKDEEHMPASSRVRKAPASDEVPEGTYYTIPPIQAETPMSSVPNFVIGRKGIGTISFKAPVDLTDISSLSALQELVKIQNSQVTLYPNESKRPPAGSGLNVRAEVSLNYRLPPDIDLEEYKEELKSTYPSTKFISYDAEKGQIVYEVEQFTTSS